MAPFDEDGKVIWRKWVEIACDLMMELAESKELQPEKSSTFKEKNKNSYGISEKMVAAVAGKVGTLLQLRSRPAGGSLVGAKYVATFQDPGETRDSPESDDQSSGHWQLQLGQGGFGDRAAAHRDAGASPRLSRVRGGMVWRKSPDLSSRA